MFLSEVKDNLALLEPLYGEKLTDYLANPIFIKGLPCVLAVGALEISDKEIVRESDV